MQIEIEQREVAILRRILEYYLGELSMEIADTDRSAFRDELRQEQSTIKSLIERLA